MITNAIESKKKCCCVHHGFSHAVEASAKPCASCMCAKNRVDAFLLTHTRLCISAAEGKLHLFSFQIRKKAAQLCHIHTSTHAHACWLHQRTLRTKKMCGITFHWCCRGCSSDTTGDTSGFGRLIDGITILFTKVQDDWRGMKVPTYYQRGRDLFAYVSLIETMPLQVLMQIVSISHPRSHLQVKTLPGSQGY